MNLFHSSVKILLYNTKWITIKDLKPNMTLMSDQFKKIKIKHINRTKGHTIKLFSDNSSNFLQTGVSTNNIIEVVCIKNAEVIWNRRDKEWQINAPFMENSFPIIKTWRSKNKKQSKSEGFIEARQILNTWSKEQTIINQNNQPIQIPIHLYLEQTDIWKSYFKISRLNFNFKQITNTSTIGTVANIPGYLLGYYLGDLEASFSSLSIKDFDNDILNKIKTDLERVNSSLCRVRYNLYRIETNNSATVGENIGNNGNNETGFGEWLKYYQIWKNKRIPHHILIGSDWDYRWELLSGLMDSNGEWDSINQNFRLWVPTENLFWDIDFLINSLGITPNKWKCVHKTIVTRLNCKRSEKFFYLEISLNRMPKSLTSLNPQIQRAFEKANKQEKVYYSLWSTPSKIDDLYEIVVEEEANAIIQNYLTVKLG